MTEEELWELRDVKYLASFFGVCNRTIYRLIQSGKIPVIKVGRSYRSTIGAAVSAFGGLEVIAKGTFKKDEYV